MITFKFLGRVLPEAMPISVDAPEIQISNPKNGLQVTLRLRIERSVIEIDGVANRYEKGDFGLMFRRALHLANAGVDLVAFAKGGGMRVILDTFVEPDGKQTPILPVEHRLAALCTAYGVAPNQQDDFDKVFNLVATTPKLFLALNDLVRGLYDPDEGATVPFRAIETIRRLFADDDEKPAEQWRLMREALRVSKEYLDPITAISTGPRHGARTGPLDGDLALVSERSWIVMNRCLEYFKRSNGPLPGSEFPLL